MISEGKAASLIQPIQRELVRIILESWEQIHASELRFKSRSRACLMWDETLYRANITWAGSKHIIKIEEKSEQTAHYWLDANTFFRIKKANRKGYTNNYPTQTALEFHEEESDLFGLANRLEVTYVLSEDESKIIDVAVVHRNGGKIDFRFSLLDEANVQKLPVYTESRDSLAPNESAESKANVAKLKPGLKPDGDEIKGNE